MQPVKRKRSPVRGCARRLWRPDLALTYTVLDFGSIASVVGMVLLLIGGAGRG